MLVLGIDPGTAICGYGVVEQKGSQLRAIEYGAIETSPKLKNEERLTIIYEGISKLIEKYKPDVVGVEELFFNKNVSISLSKFSFVIWKKSLFKFSGIIEVFVKLVLILCIFEVK